MIEFQCGVGESGFEIVVQISPGLFCFPCYVIVPFIICNNNKNMERYFILSIFF